MLHLESSFITFKALSKSFFFSPQSEGSSRTSNSGTSSDNLPQFNVIQDTNNQIKVFQRTELIDGKTQDPILVDTTINEEQYIPGELSEDWKNGTTWITLKELLHDCFLLQTVRVPGGEDAFDWVWAGAGKLRFEGMSKYN